MDVFAHNAQGVQQVAQGHSCHTSRAQVARVLNRAPLSRRSSKAFSSPLIGRRGAKLVAAVAAAEAEAEVTVEPAAEAAPAAGRSNFRSRGGEHKGPPRKGPPNRENAMPLSAIVLQQEYDGTVVSVQAYGAFVDIGAQTDGLLHISQISNGFVRDVNDEVQVGQAVKVRVINVDMATGKFGLTMKSKDDVAERAPRAERSGERGGERNDGERPQRGKVATKGKTRRAAPAPPTVKKNEEVTGKVTKVMGFGAFVDIGGGQQAMLPVSEMQWPAGAVSPSAKDLVQEGDEIKAWVLKIDGNKVNLTTKSEEERAMDKRMVEQGMGASFAGAKTTMAMALARAGLVTLPADDEASPAPTEAAAEAPAAEAEAPAAEAEPEAAVAEAEPEATPEPEVPAPEPEVEAAAPAVEETAPAPAAEAAPVAEAVVEEAAPAVVEEAPVPEPEVAPEPVAEAAAPVAEEPAPAPAAKAGGEISAALVKQLRESSGAGMMACKNALKECGGDLAKASEFLRLKGLASAEKKASRVAAEGAVWSYVHAGDRLGVLVEVNCETDFVARGDAFQELINDVAMQIAASPDVTVVSTADLPPELAAKETEIEMQKEDILAKPENIRAKIVEGRVAKTLKTMSLLDTPFVKDTDITVGDMVKSAVAKIGENIQIRRFVRFNLGEGIEKKVGNLAEEVAAQTAAMEAAAEKKAAEATAPVVEEAVEEAAPAVQVSAKLVGQLRKASGAGMMDCKKALAATGGDMEKATEWLRKKGLAGADKKAGRVASEGKIATYVHGGRLGVLVEVNCETDFVARGEKFSELVKDVAMQVAACPQVDYVSVDEFPAEELEKERAIEMQKEDLQSKPEAIRAKIVEGRVAKIASERALMEQDFIRDPSKKVSEYIKEAIAATGENIQIRRFVRFNLGEGIEKKEVDFAAEVAAQTGGVA